MVRRKDTEVFFSVNHPISVYPVVNFLYHGRPEDTEVFTPCSP